MKTKAITALCLLLTVSAARADWSLGDERLLGALLGAGAGFVVANNVDGIHRSVAVPVMALAGGIIGNQVRQHRHRDRDPDAPRYQQRIDAPETAAPDLQPGVDLIKVSILNNDGTRSDVNILRIGEQYVGPKGETYPGLPKAEELARRYGR